MKLFEVLKSIINRLTRSCFPIQLPSNMGVMTSVTTRTRKC